MNGLQTAEWSSQLDALSDNSDFQARLLDGVSRTFALTIPQLPPDLREVVANAYLLCRIVDTIEDEVAFTYEEKRRYCDSFIEVVKRQHASEVFSSEVTPKLSSQTIPAEHALMQQIPRVIEITHAFAPEQQQALANCVETMAGGMPDFQTKDLKSGLRNMQEMSEYCYYVAGCVGEMLTELFCYYNKEIAANREKMLELSVSFGQGLQMTNILKDIWDDQQRGVCWLPQDTFTPYQFPLADLSPTNHGTGFQKGLEELIGIAHTHLQNALKYTLMIPSDETGIRKFCLWALGMAVLTLRKIANNLDFTDSKHVKITRRSVKATIFTTNLCVRNDTLLKGLLQIGSLGLPRHKALKSRANDTTL